MPTKFIQFSSTNNNNEYFNVNAITKIVKAISDEWNYEERLIIHIQGEKQFMIEPTHPQHDYLLSLMEDLPGKDKNATVQHST